MTKNTAFLVSLDSKTANAIIEHIAQNYRITTEQALDEVLSDDAEDILEYLQGAVRAATSVLLQKSVFA